MSDILFWLKLKQHERIHTEESTFACNKCNHEFIMKEEFKEHERIQTEEKNFSCNKCGYKFTTQAKFKEH